MEKQALREQIWDHLEETGIARFPFPPHNRIPNFDGAPEAAEHLTDVPEWQEAAVIKTNPDAPQLPVRRRALDEGKTVYMAVPRLREEQCFIELDPNELDDTDTAATVSGMDDHGVPVSPDEMPSVDLVVAGSVAVTDDGARIGKGEGYSDLEWAVLTGFDRVTSDTTMVTTVHESQIVEEAPPPSAHDVPLDIVVTPDETYRTDTSYQRPGEINWEQLSDERISDIPVLAQLQRE